MSDLVIREQDGWHEIAASEDFEGFHALWDALLTGDSGLAVEILEGAGWRWTLDQRPTAVRVILVPDDIRGKRPRIWVRQPMAPARRAPKK